MAKKITFLGIETSCDETAAAVIRENDKGTADILSNVVSSQIEEHRKFGGVVPELAARAHLENIEYIIDSALKVSKISIDKEYSLNEKEKEVLKIIYDLPVVIKNSYKDLSPALIANYLYDLVKSYNSLYQNFNILNSESKESTSVRLLISLKTRDVISLCSELLGIDLPNKM